MCTCGTRTVSTTSASDAARASSLVDASLDEPGLLTGTVDSIDLNKGCPSMVPALWGDDTVDTVALTERSLIVISLLGNLDDSVDVDGGDLVRRNVLGVRDGSSGHRCARGVPLWWGLES